MDKYIYGGDTETIDGKPMSLQFYSEDVACDTIYFVNEKTARKQFFAWCKKLKPNCQHVMYIHKLQFDLPEFLWGKHHLLVATGSEYEFTDGDFIIKGVWGSPTYCKISDRAGKRQIWLIDSLSFFRGTLAQAAKLFCPELPKLNHPLGLGKKLFTEKNKGFVAYAMRDSVVTYHIGRAIQKLHDEFDLQQCVSVADLAARIFRHHFLSYTIPQPPRDMIEAALASYHGGKNNWNGKPGWYEDVSSLDISSAFPHAMHALPAFSNEKLYRRVLHTRATKHVHDFGIYSVSGSVSKCPWPSVYSHGFKPLSGQIDRVWVQGYEVNEALRSGELKPSKLWGYMYDNEKDHQAPALRGFVDDFYRRKETEKDPVLRFMYKLILNSLYGKFIQTRKKGAVAYTDVDANVTTTASELIAGGMFHPFIASTITAHTRARIHQLEHKYKAIHTATDGIFTQAKRVPNEGKKLGALSLEAKGMLLMIRNKCYVLYGAEGKIASAFKGRRIIKYAKHGFQGPVTVLEQLVASGERGYTIETPNTLRMAIKRGLTPNEFVKRRYVLKVGKIPIRGTE